MAASLEQFYVSVSRGKRSVTIYTDDKEALLEAVEVSSQRLSATELMQENQRELEQATTVEQWVAMAHTDSAWMKQAWPDIYQAFGPTAPTTPILERGPELER